MIISIQIAHKISFHYTHSGADVCKIESVCKIIEMAWNFFGSTWMVFFSSDMSLCIICHIYSETNTYIHMNAISHSVSSATWNCRPKSKCLSEGSDAFTITSGNLCKVFRFVNVFLSRYVRVLKFIPL